MNAFLRKHSVILLMGCIAIAVVTLFMFDAGWVPSGERSNFSPYVLCTQGSTVLKRSDVRTTVPKGQRASIARWDQIKTLPNSTATVFWADGSLTRLTEKTTIDIIDLESNAQTAKLNVDFALSEGKTWSRVYRYLSEGSRFQERFDDGKKIAAVRGTAFEIDTSSGYLRAESHAVEISDLSGKLLKTLPEGIAVKTSDLTSFLGRLDAAWRQGNLSEDFKYATELSIRTKNEILRRYTQGRTISAKIRETFQDTTTLPLSISFSGNSLQVEVPEDFIQRVQDREAVFAALQSTYEQTAVLPEDPTTIRSKEALRDAIIQLAPEGQKSSIATLFARHEIYDSWSEDISDPEELLRIRKKIRQYVTEGADEAVLRDLESSLPLEKIDAFNAKMDILKSRGIEILSREDLFFPPSKDLSDVENIANGATKFIEDATSDLIQGTVDAIR